MTIPYATSWSVKIIQIYACLNAHKSNVPPNVIHSHGMVCTHKYSNSIQFEIPAKRGKGKMNVSKLRGAEADDFVPYIVCNTPNSTIS